MLKSVQTTATDVAPRRAAGFDDQDILEISLVYSYYDMIDRIAESLGADY